ncbi:MAG TPA: DUF4277 domain-containing protein [Ktedonobacterales bacterium]|jgi:hypothetical protein|nr:DUF4277 domain-containing protein [Ktedonobacterales bacterium]
MCLNAWIIWAYTAVVCREIWLAQWLDAQDERTHERASVGTATVAMILNGLGFSNRRLYLAKLPAEAPWFTYGDESRAARRRRSYQELPLFYLPGRIVIYGPDRAAELQHAEDLQIQTQANR